MPYQKFTGSFRSSNGSNRIQYYIYEPEADIHAVFFFVPELGDSVEGNEQLTEYLTDRGILVCGCDGIGQGKSKDGAPEGVFAHKEGWLCLERDVRKLIRYVRKEYVEQPLFLCGQGIGSLIARRAALKEPVSGLILLSPAGKRRFVRRKVILSAIAKRILGEKTRVLPDERLLPESERTDFPMTISSREDILKLITVTSSTVWYASLSKDLPVCILAGNEDPTGERGNISRTIYDRLKASGHNTDLILYPGMGHFLQDEAEADRVYEDIAGWILEKTWGEVPEYLF